jgi:hypothetical protein
MAGDQTMASKSEVEFEGVPDLSVVIPAYNSAEWLPSTLNSLAIALGRTDWRPEVVVVDDGSTDATQRVLRDISPTLPFPLRVVHQENAGRFLARWAGATAGRAEKMLLLDSRVLLDPDSLAYVEQVDAALNDAWNGYAVTDPAAKLLGHFWEVPVHVVWRHFLARPRPVILTSGNFEKVPKGTTFFLVDRRLFMTMCREHWPADNARYTNDDTKILRRLVEMTKVRLEPGFRGLYRPRTTLLSFVRHSVDRGTTFVDGFGGVSGTTNAVILGAATLPLLAVGGVVALALGSQWLLLGVFFVAGGLLISLPALVAVFSGCPPRGIRAYLTYIGVFAPPYWLGVVRGVVLHRRALFSTTRSNRSGVTSQ